MKYQQLPVHLNTLNLFLMSIIVRYVVESWYAGKAATAARSADGVSADDEHNEAGREG